MPVPSIMRTRPTEILRVALSASFALSFPIISTFAQAADFELPAIHVSADQVNDSYAAARSNSATRTDTPLIDVPQSITVVSRKQISDQSMQNLADVVRYVPGVGMAQGEGNRETPILRGFSSTADFFLNGMRDDVQYYRDLYNIEKVEVLKGPNAMIFGRGGIGGVINRVTRQANWNDIREVTLQAGSYNNKRATVDVGQGFNESVAARITAVIEDSESYRDDVSLERKGINPTMSIRTGDNTVTSLGYEHFEDDRVADRGIPSFNGNPFESDESTFFGDPNRSPTGTDLDVITASVDHAFNDRLSLNNRTILGRYDKFYQNVYASGAVNSAGTTYPVQAYNNATERENFFNQTDLVYKLESGTLKHTLMGGLEVGRQKTENQRETGFFDASPEVSSDRKTFTASTTDPSINVPITWQSSGSDAINDGDTTVVALYIQDQIEFSKRFQAVFGIRYDEFKVDFNDNRPAPTGTGNITNTDKVTSPRAGLIYKPAKDISLYTSYSLSFLPRAGEQLSSLSITNKELDPEEFTNKEIGAKWDLQDDLSLTLAVYQLDKTNQAITDPNDPTKSVLVDGQRTEGIELGVSGNITPAWSIAGGYAYQQGELTETQSTTLLKGSELAQVPENSISLWNRYDVNSTWGVGLGVSQRSDVLAATENKSATAAPGSNVTLDGYTRVDGAVFLTLNKSTKMQVNIENLLDEEYYANAHNNNNITPGSPRAVRVGLTANF